MRWAAAGSAGLLWIAFAFAAPTEGARGAERPERGSVVIKDVVTALRDGVFLLDADIDFRFSGAALEALDNGVPLPIQLKIEIYRPRNWWLDDDLAVLRQRYRLQYHALSRQYLVSNANTGAVESFPTLAGAIETLGRVRDLPLLDERLLDRGTGYEARLRAKLEIEGLPLPLRPIAYLFSEWHHTSEWAVWTLR